MASGSLSRISEASHRHLLGLQPSERACGGRSCPSTRRAGSTVISFDHEHHRARNPAVIGTAAFLAHIARQLAAGALTSPTTGRSAGCVSMRRPGALRSGSDRPRRLGLIRAPARSTSEPAIPARWITPSPGKLRQTTVRQAGDRGSRYCADNAESVVPTTRKALIKACGADDPVRDYALRWLSPIS